MNTDLLFNSEEEKNATEKVLAAFKVKSLNENIDTLFADVLKYAKEMDDLLNKNNISARFLDKIANLNGDNITLDDDLNDIDFRVREVLEDLAKRINTRLGMIKDDNSSLKYIEQTYDLSNCNLDEEIKIANLDIQNFE